MTSANQFFLTQINTKMPLNETESRTEIKIVSNPSFNPALVSTKIQMSREQQSQLRTAFIIQIVVTVSMIIIILLNCAVVLGLVKKQFLEFC